MGSIILMVFLFIVALIFWTFSHNAFQRKKKVLGVILLIISLVFFIPVAIMVFTVAMITLKIINL
jgi:hypothetical protein